MVGRARPPMGTSTMNVEGLNMVIVIGSQSGGAELSWRGAALEAIREQRHKARAPLALTG